ncbi:MAG: FAD-dependent monooxygenase [Planctomycetes bacterium]|nr:FAD-dependent monooxygenase [Planctomycetota bacterium]
MDDARLDLDVLVAGGGPAGAMLAGLLARRGRRVALADDGRRRFSVPAETIQPGALRMFARMGIADALVAITTSGTLRRGSIWESDELRWQAPDEPGLRVLRGPFDTDLRAWARRMGAVVFERTHVQGPLPDSPSAEITLADAAGATRRVRTREVAIAAGGRSARALVPIEVVDQRPANAVLGLVGESRPQPMDAEIVEAVPDGWLWSMPLHDGRLSLGVFADVRLLTSLGTRVALRRLLACARGPAAGLTSDHLRRAGRVLPALRTTTARCFLVGDAASGIDPLSSQGIEKAIASAEDAAAALHTVLDEPDQKDALLAHHARWEAGLWRAHARTTAGYHARARFGHEPFWAERSRSLPEREPLRVDADEFLVVRDDLRRTQVLRRSGERFVKEDGVIAPDDGEPLSRLGTVPIPPLLAAFAEPTSLAEGVDRAGRDPRVFVLPRAAVLDAARELLRRGVLSLARVTRDAR